MFDSKDVIEIKNHPGTLPLYSSRISLKKGTDKNYTAICPFHNEKTGSFKVISYNGGWYWKCFGACNFGGDVISFITKFDNLEFPDAVGKAKTELGIGEKFSKTKIADKIFNSINGKDSKAVSYSLEEYSTYEKALEESQAGRDWLKSRGIDYETAKKMHLGFRQDVGRLSANSMVSGGGWISLPSVSGERVLAIEYRSILQKEFCRQSGMAKGDSTPLFNSDTIEPLDAVYVTEGKIDCLTMEQAGFRCVSVQSSSTPLTAANKEKLLEADCIILAGDNDQTGSDYMDKALREIQERVYKLTWPEGIKDANQLFLEASKSDISAFRDLVESLTVKAKEILVPGFSNLKDNLKRGQRIDTENSPYRWRWPWPQMDAMATIMPGSVVYLSATQTGMGKSTLMMNASIDAAVKRGEIVLNYSAELSDEEYNQIVVSYLLNKNRHELKPEDYDRAGLLLSDTRYYIGRNNDTPDIMGVLDVIEAAIRRSSATTVILDTIHFVTVNEKDPIKAQENAMNRIKSLSQKFGTKWFNLGQPRKALSTMKGKPIHITDAKGSEMLISASDAAYAIHRDVAPIDNPDKPPREPYERLTKVYLQKGRNLGIGNAYTELMFDGDVCTFFPTTREKEPERLFR